MTDQEYLDTFRKEHPGWNAWSDNDLLVARNEYQARQAREQAQKKVPCGYCGKPVPSVYVWTQVPSADDLFAEADGKFFHTDCYGVYLINRQ
jgi:hypothetical protein